MCKLWLLPLIVALAQIGTSWSQQFPQAVTTSPAQETLDEVQAKLNEINKKPIPEKEVILNHELESIDTEIANTSGQRNIANIYDKSMKKTLDRLLDQISKTARQLASPDCDKNILYLKETVIRYNREYNQLLSSFSWTNVDLDGIVFQVLGGNDIELCNNVKNRFSSKDYADSLERISKDSSKAVSDFVTNRENLVKAYENYANALKQQRNKIVEKLSTIEPSNQIKANLWALLLILAAASVATILGVKLFDVSIQMEWVASGQVIQFVTVMILLIVILALGLSGILKETTLGTLLGGLAGYVLAQGVGRAAARDVERLTGTRPPPNPQQ